MIYINECTDCGRAWQDNGAHWVWRVRDEDRDDPELYIEPVLCDDCLRVSSRASVGECAKSLSSTPKVKVQPEDDKNEQSPQHDPRDNSEMVSDKKIGGVWWRRLCCTARIAGWFRAKFGIVRQSKRNYQND